MNARNTARTHNFKYRAIQYLGGFCKICGYNKNIKALDFHHQDPSKKDFNIAHVAKRNINFEIIKKELDKCILLCSNCHRETHDTIWKESNSISWDVYNNLISYKEWPNLIEDTYQERREEKTPNYLIEKYCIDCQSKKPQNNSPRCIKCSGKIKNKIMWPSNEVLAILVWEKPRSTLAKEFGVSDKAISTHCKKRNINQPPRGYWSKIK